MNTYLAIAFTLLAVSLFEGVEVLVVRGIAVAMIFGIIPAIELYDAVRRRYNEHLTRAIMRRGADVSRRYGI